MKKLLSFNQALYETQINQIECYIEDIQEVVNAYEKLGFGSLQKDELHLLFTQPANLVFDKITKGKPLSIGDTMIDKVKAIEIVKKPDGYESLLNAIQKAVSTLKNSDNNNRVLKLAKSFDVSQVSEFFELSIEGKVIVKNSIYDRLKEQNKNYATSERAIKLFELGQLLIEKCQDSILAELVKNDPDGLPHVLKSILNEKRDGQPAVSINIDQILKYNSPSYKF